MKRLISIAMAVTLLLMGILACQLPLPQAPALAPTTVVQATSAVADATATGDGAQTTAPTPSTTAALPNTGAEVTASPAAAAGPQCTIVKNANFRKGPGTAYDPPIGVLQAGTTLVPQGFNPKGTPSGSWVQVIEPVSRQTGWVSADPQLITCNLDLTTLPQVAVEPPPPPPTPVVSNSQIDGEPNGLIGKVHISPTYLMRMEVRAPNGKKDGDGIKHVTFTISDNNGKVYQHTENTAAYCVFGGGEPNCNLWMEVNGQYFWEKGGKQVKDGTYNVNIEVEPNSAKGDSNQFGSWNFTVTIKLP